MKVYLLTVWEEYSRKFMFTNPMRSKTLDGREEPGLFHHP